MPYRGPWRGCYRPKGMGRNKNASVFWLAAGDSAAESRVQSGYSPGRNSGGEPLAGDLDRNRCVPSMRELPFGTHVCTAPFWSHPPTVLSLRMCVLVVSPNTASAARSSGCSWSRCRVGPTPLAPPVRPTTGRSSSGRHAAVRTSATSVEQGGYLYGWHGRQEQGCELRCVELRTGKVRWRKSGLKAGSVTVAVQTGSNGVPARNNSRGRRAPPGPDAGGAGCRPAFAPRTTPCTDRGSPRAWCAPPSGR